MGSRIQFTLKRIQKPTPTTLAGIKEIIIKSRARIPPRKREWLPPIRGMTKKLEEAAANRKRGPRTIVFGAYAGKKLVGVATAEHKGTQGDVDWCVVHPSFRGRGIAIALTYRRLYHLYGKGARRFYIHAGSKAGAKLTRKLEFKRQKFVETAKDSFRLHLK